MDGVGLPGLPGSYDDCRAVKVEPKGSPDFARYSEGAKAFEKACDGGLGIACFYVASYFEVGAYGKQADPAKARAMMEQACAQGDRFSCQQLGSKAREADKNDPKSFKYSSRACDLGSKPGCFQAIGQLMKGEGVAKDPARAAAILKRTCDAGEGKRCAELGMLMLEGHLPGDKNEAVGFIERGCDLGRDDACKLAAKAYAGKMGIPANKEKAKSLLKRGCKDSDDCSKLQKSLGL